MTIEYLSLFVSWVDSFLILLLHHLLHSWLHHFLSKLSRWIRGASRVEFFIFLISWGIFFVCEILIFNCSHILFSSYESSFFFFSKYAKSNHFLLAHIPHMNESHDPGRQFKVAITASAFFTYRFKLLFDLRDPCKVWLHGLCILDLHFLQLFSQIHILIYVLPFKYLG